MNVHFIKNKKCEKFCKFLLLGFEICKFFAYNTAFIVHRSDDGRRLMLNRIDTRRTFSVLSNGQLPN